jgi:transposase-like protein
VDVRWPDGVRCARCNNEKVYVVKGRPFTWVCKKCGKTPYRFSVLVGTIFKDTKMPLRAWFKVAYLMLSSKKGISALQVYRMMARTEGADYRTYWFMCMRLRAAMQNGEFDQLVGKVEVDETYVGGKQKNRHADVRAKYSGRGAANTGKTTVIGAIARKGNVVCKVIEGTDVKTLSRFVSEVVSDKVTLVATDEFGGYGWLKPMRFPHESVDHKSGEYVRGNVHTNNIENFWSLLKRGVIGTFHNVSKDYLTLYLNEFTFRHNSRHEPDQFRQLISSVHQSNRN